MSYKTWPSLTFICPDNSLFFSSSILGLHYLQKEEHVNQSVAFTRVSQSRLADSSRKELSARALPEKDLEKDSKKNSKNTGGGGGAGLLAEGKSNTASPFN